MDNNQEKLNRLATDVINLSKNILLVHIHFMDRHSLCYLCIRFTVQKLNDRI